MTTVWSTIRVPGFHAWPDAPEPVSYLGARHRHLFGFRVEVSVQHSDRDVEFHLLRRDVDQWLCGFERGPMGYEFGSRSCEHLAAEAAHGMARLGYGVLSVTVDEDGENGATWRGEAGR